MIVNSIVQLAIQIKNGIMKHISVSKKCKKDYNWNPTICICENDNYLKKIADNSVIVCDKTNTNKYNKYYINNCGNNSDGTKVRH